MYTISDLHKVIGGKLTVQLNETVLTNFSTDSRSVKNNAQTLFFALVGPTRDGHAYIQELIKQGVNNFIVSSPLVYPNCNFIQVENTLQALQEIAKAHRALFSIPVIGITGSYGKTIVKEWLYQLLSPEYEICRTPKSYNSQIGVPLSVLQIQKEHTLGIFEAGISMPNEMEALEKIIQPTIGVFTGIGEAHQENFTSLEEKEKEKFHLFVHADVIVTNALNKQAYHVPFTDKASIDNCYTCIGVMEYLKYSKEEIQNRILLLSPLALRMEMVKGVNQTTIINDSYTISYSSLEIAIDYLNEQAKGFKKSIVLSDIPNYDYTKRELIDLLNKQKIQTVVTVGSQSLTGLQVDNYFHFENTGTFLEAKPSSFFNQEYVLIKGSRAFQLEQVSLLLEAETHQTVLRINLSQVERNLTVYRKQLKPSTKLMVMVKAFAYGTGTSEIPKVLQHHGVDYLGVAYTKTGITLRQQGITIPIMVLNPQVSDCKDLVAYQLEPEIYSLGMLDQFIRALILLKRQEYPIHIKLDTGMNRLGFKSNEIPFLMDSLQSQPEVIVKSVFSHLSSADNPLEKEFTLAQISLFDTLVAKIQNSVKYPFDKHILNTSGMELYPQAQYDMVRLGIGLYGISSSSEKEIKPVTSLHSVLIQVKEVKKGESIGYNRSFIAKEDMRIGIVPIGYADGIRRSLSNGKYAFYIQGTPAPIVGNVCMDLTMIDLRNISCKEGDNVEIFGEHQSIYALAHAMETIPYEVLTSMSQRIKRVFIQE